MMQSLRCLINPTRGQVRRLQKALPLAPALVQTRQQQQGSRGVSPAGSYDRFAGPAC